MSKKVNKIIGLINEAHKDNIKKLSNHNISLGALSDMKAAGKASANSIQMLKDIEGVLDKKAILAKKALNEVDKFIDKYIQRAKKAESDITNAKKAIKDIDELSEELGLPKGQVTGYDKIIADTKQLEKIVNDATSTAKSYKNFGK